MVESGKRKMEDRATSNKRKKGGDGEMNQVPAAAGNAGDVLPAVVNSRDLVPAVGIVGNLGPAAVVENVVGVAPAVGESGFLMLPDDILRSVFSFLPVEAKGRFPCLRKELKVLVDPILDEHPIVYALRVYPQARAEHAFNRQAEFDDVALLLDLMEEWETVLECEWRLSKDEDGFSLNYLLFDEAKSRIPFRRGINQKEFNTWTIDKIADQLYTGGVYNSSDL